MDSTSNYDWYLSTVDVCLRLMRALTGLSKALSSLSVTIAYTKSEIRAPFAIVTKLML
jgi:hypothetical protein